jgi:hypothetical protein
VAHVDPADRGAILAQTQLPPALAALFVRMPRPYQWHALNVARRLLAQGQRDPILLQAALLHDVGKWDPATGRRVRLLPRIATVLLRRAPGGPRLLHRIGSGPPSAGSWRYPWYLQGHHPALGAALAARHGARPEVVALIRYHEAAATALDPEQQVRLSALQAADEQE